MTREQQTRLAESHRQVDEILQKFKSLLLLEIRNCGYAEISMPVTIRDGNVVSFAEDIHRTHKL